MSTSAYNFKVLDKSGAEGVRLSAQARAFVELELPELLSMIPVQAKVADFGCGTGVISSAIAMHLPQGEVVGLDPDDRALQLAEENGRGLGNLSFEKYGFGDPGLPHSGPYDVAFTRLVLLHLPNPGEAIAQMGRCLKPGGMLYVVDCDDDYTNFHPAESWQLQLIGIMKRAQALRGGTRVLGSKLLKLLAEQGFWPEGSRVLYYSTEKLGVERWKEIFVPALGNMAKRDLDFLAERGELASDQHRKLQEAMDGFFRVTGAKAQLSAWHAWARRR